MGFELREVTLALGVVAVVLLLRWLYRCFCTDIPVINQYQINQQRQQVFAINIDDQSQVRSRWRFLE